ncbi:MAG: RNA polymerase sigma factor, partial [Peptostreptococcaceae bacterium]
LEEKIDLYNAIDILEEKFKTPIILQYFQDMTIKEIAQILESNENTIKTYIRRGKQKLYKILKEGE